MSLTTQHFEAFAQWVADEQLMGTEESMVESFCGILDHFGKNFNKERFITSCDELQGFERGDLCFPITHDQMPLLSLNQLQLALFGATGEVKIAIQEAIDATLKVFPHLKQN